MSRRLAVILVLFAAFAYATPAFAKNNEDKAFEHFEDGAKNYAAGNYRDALNDFHAGFAIFPHPMFQVNIAVSHWRLGETPEALKAADLAVALQDQLEPEVVAENLARRHTFSTILGSQARADAIAEDLEAARIAAQNIVEPPPQPEPAKSSFGTLGWVGVGTAGAGAVTLIGWAVAETGLGKHVDAVESAGQAGDRALYDSELSKLQSKQGTARILLGTGVGLAVIGGGLITYDLVVNRADSAPQARVNLGVSGVTFHASF